MSITSRLGNIFFPKKTFELKSPIYSTENPDPISKRETPFLSRVPRQNLEGVYMESPLIFNSVNKLVQLLMSVDYTLKGDEYSVKFFTDFLENIGRKGGERTWEEVRKNIFKFLFMFGIQPVELIHNKDGNKIVDLDTIDAKTFDYARSSTMNIALDSSQNPIGYTQTLINMFSLEQKIEPPEGVHLLGTQIYIPAERIALFKMYSDSSGFFPLGIVEPIYNTYIRHKSSEEGFALASYRIGNPVPVVSMGDETHQPTEEQLKKGVEELKEMNARSSFSHKYHDKITFLEPKISKDLRTFLDYWVDMEITGLGIPSAFATGAGGEVNRDTLSKQEYFLKLTLKEMMSGVSRVIETKIFERIAELENKNSSGKKLIPPKIVFNEIALQELDSKSERISKYARFGLLHPSEDLDEWIRKTENLPKRKGLWIKPLQNKEIGDDDETEKDKKEPGGNEKPDKGKRNDKK